MRKKLTIIIFSLLSVVSLMFSAEVFAFLCKYDEVLGPKQLVVFYEPFHLVYWFFTLDVTGNQFMIAFISLGIFIAISFAFSLWFYSRYKIKPSDIYGSQRWKTTSEMLHDGITNTFKEFVILCQAKEAKYKKKTITENGKKKLVWSLIEKGTLILNDGSEHILVSAPTGSGKGINFVIPTLLAWTGSTVVYDLKRENWDVTVGWRSKFSATLRFEPGAEYSPGFNPLMEISPGKDSIADTQNIVEILANPNGDREHDHWTLNAAQLCVAVILYVLHCEREKTLSGCASFVNNPKKDIQEVLNLMLKAKIKDNDVNRTVSEIARNMLNKAEKELSSIVSTAMSFFTLYQNPYVRKNTSKSDFCIKDLMNNDYPVSLYIVVSPKDKDLMKPLVRLMLQMIGKKLTEKNANFKHRLLFMIDEFPSLGKLSFFEDQIAFMRSYGIKLALITQSLNQLYKYYSTNTSIPDNCKIKIILGADSVSEQRNVSNLLGNQTIIKKSNSQSGKFSSFMMSGKSVSETEVARPLMTPEEVGMMSFDEVIIHKGGSYPYKGKKIMYYLDDRFIAKKGKNNRANLPAPNTQEKQEKYYKFLKTKPFDWYKHFPEEEIDETKTNDLNVDSLQNGDEDNKTQSQEIEAVVYDYDFK